MPYIKTTLTDREIHLITAALRDAVQQVPGRGTANATLTTQVSREYTGLQALLERFVSDLSGEDPNSTPPARVKPFVAGQPLFKFNVYSDSSSRYSHSRLARTLGFNAFIPVPLTEHSYVRMEYHGEFRLRPDGMTPARRLSRRLIGSLPAIERVVMDGMDCVDDECGCQEGHECANESSTFFVNTAPKSYTAYLPATSPVLEYINTSRRRRCRDEMLADMSGSLLPLLTREEIRETLNVNRTEMRYAETPALLVAHKIMALASIANTAPAEYLDDANIVATIDVLL